MTTYTVIFRTADTWATEFIDADTAELAMQQARALVENDANSLDWCTYDPSSIELDEIEITGPDGTGACWQSDDLALRLGAQELAETLTALIEQIDSLAGESSCIDEDIMQGDAYRQAAAAIAKAKGGVS